MSYKQRNLLFLSLRNPNDRAELSLSASTGHRRFLLEAIGHVPVGSPSVNDGPSCKPVRYEYSYQLQPLRGEAKSDNPLINPMALPIPFVGIAPVFRYVDTVKNFSLAMIDYNSTYLYILRYPLDRKFGDKQGQAFYVGIGRARRYAFHYLEADGGGSYDREMRNYHKRNTINKIGKDKVLIQVVTDKRLKLNDLEVRLIAHWGRRNVVDNPGILTNQTAGGEGVPGIPMPAHVKASLIATAHSPIVFNGEYYDGLKPAFNAHLPDALAEIFSRCLGKQITAEDKRCCTYQMFKMQLHRWSNLGFFPQGFNYLDNEGLPLFDELPVSSFLKTLVEKNSRNRKQGYERARKKRYPNPKIRTPCGDFRTYRDAAAASDGKTTAENLTRRFRLMRERNHFCSGYNILNDDGTPQFKEHRISLQEAARTMAADHLVEYNSAPMTVNGELVPTRYEAWKRCPDFPSDYPAFMAFVTRCKEFGAFPKGLNVPQEEGGPYPQIPRFFISHPLCQVYYRIDDQDFPNLQTASIALGYKHKNAVHGRLMRYKNRFKEKEIPFPKGWNVIDTFTGEPMYPEQPGVNGK